MRSIKELLVVDKFRMVIGKYYILSTGEYDWLFRFYGFDDIGGEIMSDITYIRRGYEWEYFDDKVNILCYKDNIVGDIIKCLDINKKLNPH